MITNDADKDLEGGGRDFKILISVYAYRDPRKYEEV
jgi:hypothetical protein